MCDKIYATLIRLKTTFENDIVSASIFIDSSFDPALTCTLVKLSPNALSVPPYKNTWNT